MTMFGPRHVRIIKHHRSASVYQNGRYLHVDMVISTRSKNGRRIARETAEAVLNEVGRNEDAYDVMNPTVQDPPHPPDSFTAEEGRAAVAKVSEERKNSVSPMPIR